MSPAPTFHDVPPEHDANDVAGLGAERHADAEFVGPRRHA